MSTQTQQKTEFKGNDKVLLGFVLAVVTYWLFAGTIGNLVSTIVDDIGTEYISESIMSLAAPIAGLFSGLFIVVLGGMADRVGRVKMTMLGLILSVVGSALLVLASGPLATPLMLTGRVLQGLSTAMIMPSTMALLKTYWEGEARQRAVSMWSIGSWGGSGFAAVFGGIVAQQINWRWIFIINIIVSILAMLLIWGTPESKVEQKGPKKRFDWPGLIVFLITLLSLMVALIFGAQMPPINEAGEPAGWTSPITLGLAAVAVIGMFIFVRIEQKADNPFIDFGLFKNTTFTGATISNFLANATIGLLNVSQLVLIGARQPGQDGYLGTMGAGLLTLSYGIMIVTFIRFGEKLLQRFGPRKPMIWGMLIVILSALFLTPTFVYLDTYKILAVIGYGLFGLGLAFYATPSTDAALSNLPADQAGAGSGIYKMASSLGGALGLAISLAVFNALKAGEPMAVGVEYVGVQDNVSLRFAGMVVMIINAVMALAAILSIVMTVPKGGGSRDGGKMAESAAPAPQPTLDESKQQIIDHLSALPLKDLQRIEKQILVNELADLDDDVLRDMVRTKRGG
ncbi:MFS transporter [Trueperella bialowiezensis]|uniref:Quinolone resistance protein norB n=1 Tax=Trueperella bialowiezensis TaxID=312285 RepID=A0A448PDP3_9ACTO|nr:MFS transporter [Trueperella bialowiezensis]VEI13053.1 Quinolone resistance protein norB [Trueperella bialowiezensis]